MLLPGCKTETEVVCQSLNIRFLYKDTGFCGFMDLNVDSPYLGLPEILLHAEIWL